MIEGIRVGCWAVAVLLLACTPAPAAEPALVIQGASFFDAASGTMKPDRTIVLSGQKIQAIGTLEQPAVVPRGREFSTARRFAWLRTIGAPASAAPGSWFISKNNSGKLEDRDPCRFGAPPMR